MPETRQCAYCGADVTRAPSRFNGEKAFCDNECRGSWMESKVEVECEVCGETVVRAPSRLEKYDKTFCSRECVNEYQTGENAPNWSGGSDKFSVSKRGREWRNAVFERDDYTCQDCGIHGSEAYLNAHHIKPRSTHPELEDDVSNGVTLCERCHAERHEGEKAYNLIMSNVRKHGVADD